VQQFIFGLANGSIYALMALAIGMVFSTTEIINFCHASVIMLGAMTSYWCMAFFHLPYLIAILIAIFINVGINMAIYKTCVEKLGKLSTNIGWIVTLFGASIIIDNAARMYFGTEPQAYPYLFGGKLIQVFGANIMLHEIMMIVISLVIGLAYQLLIKKTRFGRAVRAVSFRHDTARLMGIKSDTTVLFCFGLAGVVAAISGALIAPITFASYNMMSSIGLKGFAAALIGGLGNTQGAFIGGISLGLIETLIGSYIPAAYKDAISFFVMIIVIIFLPGGILGAKFFTKGNSGKEKI